MTVSTNHSNEQFVLITPARNEEKYLDATIQSVVNQTLKPLKWLIISDGSTDRTEEIVTQYADAYDFIELMALPAVEQRNFGSKVRAINNGFKDLQSLQFEYFGNLDADITLDEDYYERVIDAFQKNPRIGIAGGLIHDVIDGIPKAPIGSMDNVGCAIQMFRRQCYIDIGGYLPLEKGGEDTIAEVMAKINNWEVVVIKDLRVYHHRRMGTGHAQLLIARFQYGVEEYYCGSLPLFVFVKSLYRFREKPYVFAGLMRLFGFIYACLSRVKYQVPDDVVKVIRQNQKQKLRKLFVRS
jgi:glycosyltransferase involved in cell wall biosynthesis